MAAHGRVCGFVAGGNQPTRSGECPYQNAIWHGFVFTAAMVHFAAVSGMVAAAG